MPSDEDIRTRIHDASERLTRATHEMALLFRRKDFVRELHEKGSWLKDGEGDPPPWVQAWSAYWDSLKANPAYRHAQRVAEQAHADLHSDEFEAGLEGLRRRDPAGVEYGIAYLEADPWYFRSGYLKGRIARWLRQVELSAPQQERLRQVILAALARGNRYEQVEYRKLARRLDTSAFREELRHLAASADTEAAHRATLALRFCELNDTPGRDLRAPSKD